jgi:hypothetical protein
LEELIQPGLPDVVVLDPDGKGWPEPLRKALSALKPTWRNSVPTYELELHENLNGEITISDTSGNVLYIVPTPNDYQVPYEAVFRQSINPLLYEPWLNRYKLRARITLLPQDSVEHYLYAQAEQEAYAQQQAAPEQPMMLMSGGSDELAISGMELLTNGFRLTVSYPASFSGQVWSVYQQNTPALTADLTNSFNGLESTWSLAFDSLVLTGETATSWTDTQPMGSDTNGNPLHRFYGVGSNEVDSDEDGLSDAVEQFIHHTLPGTSDTDGDNLPDGWEVEHGLDPRSSVGDDGYQGDPDHDGWINGQEYEDWTDPQDRLDANRFGPGIMISELVYRPAAGQNQWIELFNANEYRLPIDLGGFRIQRTQDGVYTTVLTIPSSTFIQPGDTLLVSGSGSGVTGDLIGPIDLEQPFDGTVSHTAGLRLIKPEGTPVGAPLVVDACLYDRPNQHACADQGFDAYTNGTFAPFTLAGNSLTRAWPGRDYNIGGSEWRWTNNPTPRAAGTGTDPDGDGLTTLQEWTGSNNPFGGWPTDPFDPDSDGDGLADGAEVTGTPATDPLGPDTDADDFPWDSGSTTWDHQETALGTSPINPDTDGDGLYDGWEVALGLNPLVADSDSDGTGDGQEDGDGDGVSNQAEQAANSNPMNATQTTGGPYHYWHKPPKDGWANGDDVGYGGVLTVYFEGLKTGQVVCVVLKEGGGMAEKLSVQWQGAATPTCWSGARTGITAAVVAPGRNTMRLVVTDQSPAPDLSESNQGADIYYEPIEHPDLDGPGLFDRWPNQDEEDQEMTNGHVVVVNDDDDSPSQGNENWDHEDALGAKTNDARIRPFSLASLDGKWSTVKLTWQPQSKVAVYQDYGAGRSPVASGDTFEVTNLPDLFMEGLEASAAMRDTIMTASYDCEVCSDQIALTVVSADVDGDSNGDGSIDDLDDELEGSTNHPVFVSVNDNDSNGDGTNDHLNLVIDGASDLAEMTEIRVERIKPYDLPVGTVKLSGASNMRVFIADGTLVKPAAGDAASAVDLWTNLPCTLWAEGVGPGRDELTLTYRYQRSDGGTTEFSDVIQVCILKVDTVDVDSSDTETHKIPAVSGAAHDDHFVCVKDTGDIVLNATVSPIDSAVLDQLVWEADGATITYPAVGTDKRTAKLSSATSQKIPVRIKVGGSTCWEGATWVVWSSGQKVADRPIHVGTTTIQTGDGTTGPGILIDGGYDFKFTITPASLITDSDRPDLSGTNSYSGFTVDPPGAGTLHFIFATDIKGGAAAKWDVSRRIKAKVLNPHLYDQNKLDVVPGTLWNNQPVASDLPVAFPGDDRAGNDDTSTGDESNNPYSASSSPHNTHAVGEISSTDAPNHLLRHSTGSDGDTFELRYHFGEFARVLLADQWYRCSDFFDWRAHFKIKRQAGQWVNDGSSVALDNSGF